MLMDQYNPMVSSVGGWVGGWVGVCVVTVTIHPYELQLRFLQTCLDETLMLSLFICLFVSF